MTDFIRVPAYVAQMIRQPPPDGAAVVPGTTPVVSFGNVQTAVVATLGINPSHAEFTDDRGLRTLESLGAHSTSELTDDQVQQVVDGCYDYFRRNPYRTWFDKLEGLVASGLGVSYYEGTACHLDLSPRATDPIWSKLNSGQRKTLLNEGASFLKSQLRSESVATVVVNGDQTWRQIQKVGLVDFEDVGVLQYGERGQTYKVRVGERDGVRYIGWTMNRQGSHGFRFGDDAPLVSWIREVST